MELGNAYGGNSLKNSGSNNSLGSDELLRSKSTSTEESGKYLENRELEEVSAEENFYKYLPSPLFPGANFLSRDISKGGNHQSSDVNESSIERDNSLDSDELHQASRPSNSDGNICFLNRVSAVGFKQVSFSSCVTSLQLENLLPGNLSMSGYIGSSDVNANGNASVRSFSSSTVESEEEGVNEKEGFNESDWDECLVSSDDDGVDNDYLYYKEVSLTAKIYQAGRLKYEVKFHNISLAKRFLQEYGTGELRYAIKIRDRELANAFLDMGIISPRDYQDAVSHKRPWSVNYGKLYGLLMGVFGADAITKYFGLVAPQGWDRGTPWERVLKTEQFNRFVNFIFQVIRALSHDAMFEGMQRELFLGLIRVVGFVRFCTTREDVHAIHVQMNEIVGKYYDILIAGLQSFGKTIEENREAYKNVKTHSVENLIYGLRFLSRLAASANLLVFHDKEFLKNMIVSVATLLDCTNEWKGGSHEITQEKMRKSVHENVMSWVNVVKGQLEIPEQWTEAFWGMSSTSPAQRYIVMQFLVKKYENPFFTKEEFLNAIDSITEWNMTYASLLATYLMKELDLQSPNKG